MRMDKSPDRDTSRDTQITENYQITLENNVQWRFVRFDDLVGLAREQHPIPIPNSAVKALSANGTAS